MSDPAALKAEFDRFDVNGSGVIEEEEFMKLLEALRVVMSPEMVHIAFKAIDVNGNGHIDFSEFAAWYRRQAG
jgi:calmodulin/calcium-binding protein CML/calcium-binding protein